jgi:nicotinamidase-related amidase
MGKTALLLLDLQQGILGRVKEEVNVPKYIHKVNDITKAAQAASVPTIYVRTGFRTGYPDISPNNTSFARVAASGSFTEDDLSFRFHTDLAIHVGDIVVTKRRISAFTGSDLEVVLRSSGVDHLVILGISTSNSVLSTVRQAADLDYKLTVLGDMCFDPQPDVGKFLLENVLKRQARILGWEEWVREIEGT